MTIGEGGREVLFAGGLIGGQSIFGDRPYNFDPLGLSEKLSFALPWLREAELKHGRVAMLAFLGLLGPEIIRVPEFAQLAPKCNTAGLGGELRVVEAHDLCVADQLPVLPMSPMMPLLLAAGAIEVATTIQKLHPSWGGLTVENAGDYPMREEIGAKLDQLPRKDTDMVVLKLKELKHCRLAMIAFSGAWAQGVLTGHGFPWVW